MSDLPRPVTTDQRYLHELCDLLAEQNRLLAKIHGLDEVKQPDDAGVVALQLQEPATPVVAAPKTLPRTPPRRGKRGA